jgi:hypothetical protein
MLVINRESVKVRQPPTIKRRRLHTSPKTPMKGSIKEAMIPGKLRSNPI